MTIKTKAWKAQINRMPHDKFFRVEGIVTVPHTGVSPALVLSPIQDKSYDLRLILLLDTIQGVSLPVVTDETVTYKVSGDSNVTGVSIFFEGELLHHIDDVLITH